MFSGIGVWGLKVGVVFGGSSGMGGGVMLGSILCLGLGGGGVCL